MPNTIKPNNDFLEAPAVNWKLILSEAMKRENESTTNEAPSKKPFILAVDKSDSTLRHRAKVFVSNTSKECDTDDFYETSIEIGADLTDY